MKGSHVNLLRDALQRGAAPTCGRQSRLAWIQHAAHAADKLAAELPDSATTLRGMVERLEFVRVQYEAHRVADAWVSAELALLRQRLR